LKLACQFQFQFQLLVATTPGPFQLATDQLIDLQPCCWLAAGGGCCSAVTSNNTTVINLLAIHRLSASHPFSFWKSYILYLEANHHHAFLLELKNSS
jgi:hypothetical protein